MNNEKVTVKVESGSKEYLIDLSIPNSYQYKMDRTTLMVGKDFEPAFGKIVGFYFYKIANYDNINENNYFEGASSDIKIRNFDYKTESIFGHEFKTYCTEYLDDHTINKTYISKVNDKIIGRLEIQKFGTKDASDYNEASINELLAILVNVEVNDKISNNSSNNDNNSTTQRNYADVVIESLNKSGSTSNMLFIFAGLFLIGALIFYIADKEMVVISVVCIILAVVFVLMCFSKKLIGKKNLKNINLDEIRSDALKECISFENVKTFFTPNYIISNYYHPFAIKYSDVVWIYPMDKIVNGIKVGSDLYVCLINNKKQYLPNKSEFIDIIKEHNSNVIVGYSFENKKQYKEIIKNNGQK